MTRSKRDAQTSGPLSERTLDEDIRPEHVWLLFLRKYVSPSFSGTFQDSNSYLLNLDAFANLFRTVYTLWHLRA